MKRAGEVFACSRVGRSCLHFKAPEAVLWQEGLSVTLGREASLPQGNGEADGM